MPKKKSAINAIQKQIITNLDVVLNFDKMKEDRMSAIVNNREIERRIEALEASRP